MWNYKYGTFQDKQMSEVKVLMRKQIYFLLLCVDKKTRDNYEKINVSELFEHLLSWFDGLNEILEYPAELVKAISLLEEARLEYGKTDFDFLRYRKLILDAGNEVMRIKEV